MTTEPDDRLDGARAIGEHLGWPARRVYRIREEGWPLPVYKGAWGIYAYRSDLDEWRDRQGREL